MSNALVFLDRTHSMFPNLIWIFDTSWTGWIFVSSQYCVWSVCWKHYKLLSNFFFLKKFPQLCWEGQHFYCGHGPRVTSFNIEIYTLLAMIALSAFESCKETYVHNAFLFINTFDNAWYNDLQIAFSNVMVALQLMSHLEINHGWDIFAYLHCINSSSISYCIHFQLLCRGWWMY